jgi:hypothetical protein
MITHVHKVIHLVVVIFEQGWRSWLSEGGVFHCETMTGRPDPRPVCPVSSAVKSVASVSDRTLAQVVT